MWPFLYTLLTTHITIISVTLFLHRGQAHRGISFHPILAHAMRFWLWLTTGMITKEWVAIHRKHHRYSDQPGDPHSPHVYGISSILFLGVFKYVSAGKDHDMIKQYGVGTPDDWVERNIYTRFHKYGIILLLLLNFLFFGFWGFVIWLIQMVWIPFWAAGVINGVGHWFGYRNGQTNDHSKNIVPWGILIGGEELHNNHHLNPANMKMSRRWFEFDIGYLWLKFFSLIGLAKINRPSTV